jgi:predicted nucleic acid-binding protein
MVLEVAVNGRADAIVTFNLRDFVASAKQFGIAVISADENRHSFRQNLMSAVKTSR